MCSPVYTVVLLIAIDTVKVRFAGVVTIRSSFDILYTNISRLIQTDSKQSQFSVSEPYKLINMRLKIHNSNITKLV